MAFQFPQQKTKEDFLAEFIGTTTPKPQIQPPKTKDDFLSEFIGTPTPMPTPQQEPTKPQITWEDVLSPIMESQEKLWGGGLGVKIGGKTPTQQVGEEIIGLGEGAVSAASGLIAFIPSLIAGVGAKAMGKSFQEAEAVQQKIASLLTHEPITEKGETYSEIANSPFAMIGHIIEKGAELGADDPETESMLRMAGGVGLLVAGAYLHGNAKAVVEQAVKTGKSLKQVKNIIKKSKEVPPEAKVMVEKIPDLPPELKPSPEQIAEQKMIHEQAGVAHQETLAKKMAELKGEKPIVFKEPYKEPRGAPKLKTQEELRLQAEFPTRPVPGKPKKPAKVIKEYPEEYITEQNRLIMEEKLREAEKQPSPEIEWPKTPKEFYAGYNILEELKQSVRFLRGEKPEIRLPKKLTKKDVSLEPSKTPKTQVPPEEIPMPSAGQQIYDALVEAKPLRKEQEVLYTKERGQKMAIGLEKAGELKGRERAEAFRKAQAGAMEKLQFEPIKGKVSNKAMEEMYDVIWDSPAITEWERLSANEGLTKLLEGKVPQEGEIILLDRVFPKSITKALMKKRTKWQKIKHGLLEASGIPRAVMASWDVSAPFRQGVFLGPRYPKQFFGAFAKMFKQFGSEKAFKAVWDGIVKRDTYKYMRRDELALTEMDSALKLREEPYMSHWAEKVPLVRPSGRAYSGFLNLLRADVYDLLFKNAERLGLDPKKDAKLGASISNFVNVGSGRGSLKSVLGVNLEKSAVILNQALFSPRLMSSRFKILNPAFYIKAHPFVRKQALQTLLAFASTGTAILTIAKTAGLEVGTEPTSSTFGKIKAGDTWIDIWGGFQQYIRTGTQLAFGKTTSPETGEPTELKGLRVLPYPKLQKGERRFAAPSQASIIARWASYKQAPVLSFFTDLLKGTTTSYEDIDFTKGFDEPLELSDNPIAQRFIPMVMQDLMDILRTDPDLAPISALGLFGIGLQTYGDRGKKKGFSLGR